MLVWILSRILTWILTHIYVWILLFRHNLGCYFKVICTYTNYRKNARWRKQTKTIIKFPTLSNVSSSVFNSWIPIHIWQQTKAKAICIIWWIRKPININTWPRCTKHFSNTIIQLIVHYRTPILWLLVGYWLSIWMCQINWINSTFNMFT